MKYITYIYTIRYFSCCILTNIVMTNIIRILSFTYLLLKDPNVVHSPHSALNHRKSLVGFQ